MYKIVRVYFYSGKRSRTIKRGLTLKQAKAHCSDFETSSSTCTKAVNKRRTAMYGPWFDSYTKDIQ